MLHIISRRVLSVLAVVAILGACGAQPSQQATLDIAPLPSVPTQVSVSHPIQITLRQALAPRLGAYLKTELWAHNALPAQLAAIRTALTPSPSHPHASTSTGASVHVVSSFSAPGSAIYATGSVNGYPCGGQLPTCCTLSHESGGTPTAQNPNSSASGLWQFLTSTFDNVTGLTGPARNYSAAIQNAAAVKLYAGGSGWGAWKGDHCYPGG